MGVSRVIGFIFHPWAFGWRMDVRVGVRDICDLKLDLIPTCNWFPNPQMPLMKRETKSQWEGPVSPQPLLPQTQELGSPDSSSLATL